MTDISDRVKIERTQILSDEWCELSKVTFAWRRRDGSWHRSDREVYARGDAAVILLYDTQRRTVVLTRQFRMPAYRNGYRELMIEAAAGLLDGAAPEERIRAEAEEETGYRVGALRKLFELFMGPGAITEKMHFFAAPYVPGDRVGAGGGIAHEGEDIEVFEIGFDDAFAMIADGRIVDAKTVILLQWAERSVWG